MVARRAQLVSGRGVRLADLSEAAAHGDSDITVNPLLPSSRRRKFSQGEVHGREVTARADKRQRMKKLMVTKYAGPQSRSFHPEEECAERVGNPTADNQPKARRSASSIDLWHDGDRGPTHHQVRQRVHPVLRVHVSWRIKIPVTVPAPKISNTTVRIAPCIVSPMMAR